MILFVTVYFYTKRMAATTVHKKVLASFKNKKTQESLFKIKKEERRRCTQHTKCCKSLRQKDGGKSNVYTNQQLYHMV